MIIKRKRLPASAHAKRSPEPPASRGRAAVRDMPARGMPGLMIDIAAPRRALGPARRAPDPGRRPRPEPEVPPKAGGTPVRSRRKPRTPRRP
jgi:hypothetical protein